MATETSCMYEYRENPSCLRYSGVKSELTGNLDEENSSAGVVLGRNLTDGGRMSGTCMAPTWSILGEGEGGGADRECTRGKMGVMSLME